MVAVKAGYIFQIGWRSMISRNRNSDDELDCVLYDVAPFRGALFRASVNDLFSLADLLVGTVDSNGLGSEMQLKGTITPNQREATENDPNHELTYSQIIFRLQGNASVIAITKYGPTEERSESDTIAFSGAKGNPRSSS